VNLLWPPSADPSASVVHEGDLESLYRYPGPLDVPYIRLNYVCTANGKIAVDGRSAALASNADKLLFDHLRRLADVVLVGAGTARADNYRGSRSWPGLRAERRARGQAEVAPVAVVTASADLDTDSLLFADSLTPPLVLTVRSAPAAKVARLEEAGAEILFVGDKHAEVEQIKCALASRGLNSILCEGGPTLYGSLLSADAVDEVCLTLVPRVGGAGEMSAGATDLRPMRLESVLTDDGVLLMRYRRE
jgi:riboflavin-specific deaminase-like protein